MSDRPVRSQFCQSAPAPRLHVCEVCPPGQGEGGVSDLAEITECRPRLDRPVQSTAVAVDGLSAAAASAFGSAGVRPRPSAPRPARSARRAGSAAAEERELSMTLDREVESCESAVAGGGPAVVESSGRRASRRSARRCRESCHRCRWAMPSKPPAVPVSIQQALSSASNLDLALVGNLF